jgi:hypothetical protein
MSSEIVAARLDREIILNARNPAPEWELAEPIRFWTNWQGKNPAPDLETEVRLLWSPMTLYLRFACRYRELFVFEDSEPSGRRDYLWDRDVAEAFLQPIPSPECYYKEFEVAPNGMWIDLDITPSGLADLKSGLTRSVHLDDQHSRWDAELAVPLRAFTADALHPGTIWRANFYRIEGKIEPRRYLAWRPTNTPQPSFHVPEKFGNVRFA